MPVFSCRCVSLAVMSGTVLRLRSGGLVSQVAGCLILYFICLHGIKIKIISAQQAKISASSWLFDFVSYFLAWYKNGGGK